MVYAAARTGIAELALSGCTTVFDHHYVFPRGTSGLVEAELRAAAELRVTLIASRGSMDLGESRGGLPPDELVEEVDAVLAETERLADAYPESWIGPRSKSGTRGRTLLRSASTSRLATARPARAGCAMPVTGAQTTRGWRTATARGGSTPESPGVSRACPGAGR